MLENTKKKEGEGGLINNTSWIYREQNMWMYYAFSVLHYVDMNQIYKI